MLESSQREVEAARRLAALETDLRRAEQGRPSPSNIRVKAEIEWPSYDGMDTYYDIDEFFRDLSRVMMLASGGRGGASKCERCGRCVNIYSLDSASATFQLVICSNLRIAST